VKYYKYKTLQGDTFDIIALDFYKDEKKASEIIKVNPQYADLLIFDAGVELKIPILNNSAPSTLPPWKR